MLRRDEDGLRCEDAGLRCEIPDCVLRTVLGAGVVMEDTSFEPDSLAFEIRGWVSWSVRWWPDYRLISYRSPDSEGYRRPTADEWRTFWTAIDEDDVWDWERSY